MDTILKIKSGSKRYEGSVTYEEGDLIEAVFGDQPDLSVGDQLPCLMTTNDEVISRFEAVVIAKAGKRLFLFHSPTAVEFREQRRRYPRFDTDIQGWLEFPPEDRDRFGVANRAVRVINLSLGGIAIRSETPLPVDAEPLLFVELYGRNQADGLIRPRLQIIHERVDSSHYDYGCRIRTIRSQSFHNLRKYILQRQLEERRLLLT